jgi:hypothetical protein
MWIPLGIIRINPIYISFQEKREGGKEEMKQQFVRGSIASVLTAALLAVPCVAFGADYSDLRAGHWAYDAVTSVSGIGIVNGYPDGTFKPSGTVTYGEFIKMAFIAQGGEELAANGGGWALPYYEAASGAGLFASHEIAEYLLSSPIPREYMALILSNILGDVEVAEYDAVREKINDIEWDAPHEYDIVKVAACGLITGYPDGTFRPEGTLTRAEAAAVIHRLIDADARREPDLRPPEEKTPAERLKDAEAEAGSHTDWLSWSPFYDVVESSVSKKPISDIIDDTSGVFTVYDPVMEKNLEIPFGNIDDDPILYYEIFENYPYQMKLVPNLVGNEMLVVGTIQGPGGYLIRDRKVIARLTGSADENGEGTVYVRDGEGFRAKTFPDFDYVGVSPHEGNVILLIPNNMK